MRALPPPDQAALRHPKARHTFIHMLQESVWRGTRGPQVDAALMLRSWEFDPAAIAMPAYLWHGAQDQNAPVAMARHLAATIPASHLRVYPEVGHLSIMSNHAEEIFQTLRAA
jgi:pimeloyl-ACP methyl ester carboxylesterase